MSELSSQLDGKLVTVNKAVTDVISTSLDPVDVQAFSRLAFWIQNTTGAVATIAAGVIEASPTIAGPWEPVFTYAAGLPLADGDTLFQQVSDVSWKYMRVRLTAGVAELPLVSIWVSPN